MNPKPCTTCGNPDKDARHRMCRPCTLAWYTTQLDIALMGVWS